MPFSITEHGDYYQLRLSGHVVQADITGMLEGLSGIEKTKGCACDALLVMEEGSNLDLHFSDLFPIGRQLDQLPVRYPSLSAIVTRTPVQTGVARMWQALAHHPNIIFEVFDSVSSAEAWLRSQRGR